MAQLSKGVKPNGMLPGHEPTMDPSKAGDDWATFEISEDEIPKHYVLPTKKGDKPPDDKTGFKGDAAERFRTSQLNGKPQHYGAFDDDDRAAAFIKSKQSKAARRYGKK